MLGALLVGYGTAVANAAASFPSTYDTALNHSLTTGADGTYIRGGGAGAGLSTDASSAASANVNLKTSFDVGMDGRERRRLQITSQPELDLSNVDITHGPRVNPEPSLLSTSLQPYGFQPSMLIDGDVTTAGAWANLLSCTENTGAYVEIDLKFEAAITAVQLWHEIGYVTCQQQVDLSLDGVTWTTVFTTGDSGPVETAAEGTYAAIPEAVKARYVRHYFTGNLNGGRYQGGKLSEVKLFGYPGVAVDGNEKVFSNLGHRGWLSFYDGGSFSFSVIKQYDWNSLSLSHVIMTPQTCPPDREHITVSSQECFSMEHEASGKRLRLKPYISGDSYPDLTSSTSTQDLTDDDLWFLEETSCDASVKCYLLISASAPIRVRSTDTIAMGILEEVALVSTSDAIVDEDRWMILGTNEMDCSTKNTMCSDEMGKCYCLDPWHFSDAETAKSACADEGYELASILSDDEAAVVGTLISGDPWIGLVEGHGRSTADAARGLKWLSGADVSYLSLPDSYSHSAGTSPCFYLSSGVWQNAVCSSADVQTHRPALCQKHSASKAALQEAFFALVPDGICYLHGHYDGSFLTGNVDSSVQSLFHAEDQIYSIGPGVTPGGVDRFRFIPDKSGTGVLIQMASSELDSEGNSIPTFSENEDFIGVTYEDGVVAPFPKVVSRQMAPVFILESKTGLNIAPYGLRLKYDPAVFLGIDISGQVRYTYSDYPALRYSLDIRGAPSKYRIVVVLDEIDFTTVLQQGTMETGIAVERVVTSTMDGTVSLVELSTDQTEERTITTTRSQLFEKTKSSAETTTVGGEVSATVEGKIPFVGSASVTATGSYSEEATVEQGARWENTNTDENSVTQSRTITISDSLEVTADAGDVFRCSLVIVTKRVKNLSVNAQIRLYADETLIATSEFPVMIDAVTVSSGSVQVERISSIGEEPVATTSAPTTTAPSLSPSTSSPTQTPESYHWLACGAIHTEAFNKCGNTFAVANDSDQYPVRCCSDSTLTSVTAYDKCGKTPTVYGFSECSLGDQTYDQAKASCESYGGRLCTHTELEDGCTHNTGCSRDYEMVWSSTAASL